MCRNRPGKVSSTARGSRAGNCVCSEISMFIFFYVSNLKLFILRTVRFPNKEAFIFRKNTIMILSLKSIVTVSTFALLCACSSAPPDPYVQFAEQERQSDQTVTSTAASFADKYPPSSVSHCETMTHESYEKGTRCYRVINRNWERDYKQAYDNADKRTRAVLKRYHSSFSAYYLSPAAPAKQKAAERSYEQLRRRIGS